MKPLYRIVRALCRFMLKIDGANYIGQENIPADEPLLLIANHSSYGDPPIIASVYTQGLTFVAKEAFAHNPLTRCLFGVLGAHFLSKGESDFSAMRTVIKELQTGQSVLIFPEGTRRFDQKIIEFQPGAAYIAQKTQVRVLPIALLNSGDFWHFWKRNIIVNIGTPIDPPPAGRVTQDTLNEYTAMYHDRVTELFNVGLDILQRKGKKMRTISKSKLTKDNSAHITQK